ncbi:hypothetical protein J4219_02050 [Candidatus Woesearchaeota archaeon]|nr:hypothetical protein [Candidatus Woesearchaeota archaeon]
MKRTLAALAIAFAGCTAELTPKQYEDLQKRQREDALQYLRENPDALRALDSGIGRLERQHTESESRTNEKLEGFQRTLDVYENESGRAVRSAETATMSAEALRETVERDLGEFRSGYDAQIGEVAERAAGVINRVEGIEDAHEGANRAYEERFLPAHEQRERTLQSLDETLRTARTPEEIRLAIEEARRAGQ